jgi:hypothetical protein
VRVPPGSFRAPNLIQESLGHASIQITLDRYGHLLPKSYDDASGRLEATLFGGDGASEGVETARGPPAAPFQGADTPFRLATAGATEPR